MGTENLTENLDNFFLKYHVKYPIIGGRYEHYKGGIYEVISMATHSETNEPMVIYKSALFGSVYARPLSIWNEDVSIPKDDSCPVYGPRFRFMVLR